MTLAAGRRPSAEVRRATRRALLAPAPPAACSSLVARRCTSLAAVAGLAAPRLLGDLVEAVQDGTTTATSTGSRSRIAGFVVVADGADPLRPARLARARRAGAGRAARGLRRPGARRCRRPRWSAPAPATCSPATSRDVDAAPAIGALRGARDADRGVTARSCSRSAPSLLVSPLLLLPALLAVPVLWCSYPVVPPPRATDGYLRESAAYADDHRRPRRDRRGRPHRRGAAACGRRRVDRTDERHRGVVRGRALHAVPAHRLVPDRRDRLRRCPASSTLLLGGWFVRRRAGSRSARSPRRRCTSQQLIDPVDRCHRPGSTSCRSARASLARLLGVAQVPDDRTPTGRRARRRAARGRGRAVRLRRRAATCCTASTWTCGPASGSRWSGPPAPASRRSAGCWPASTRPRTGSVTVGGVGLAELPLDDLRGHVALVTQEHHVFVGTLRDNLVLARPGAHATTSVRAALAAVDALDWVRALPDGLDTVVGSGGVALSPAQAQQVALARLVLADPHTLVLDEATSLIDPRAARHLERSLAAVLDGRTVIAIAHRLFSAHDADRVAVVEDGRISELGSHDELVARRRRLRRPVAVLARHRPPAHRLNRLPPTPRSVDAA